MQVSQPRYCHLEKAIIRSRSGLHVACTGYEICEPDYRVKRTRFPCYGLEYVESGTGTVKLNDRSFPLRAGVLFIYGPTTLHHIASDSKTPLRKYFVDFFGRESSRLLGAGGGTSGMAVQVADLEAFRGLFEMLLTEGERGFGGAQKICASLLRIIIWKTAGARRPETSDEGWTTETFQRCRDLIDARHLELRNLDEIAYAASIDKSYLCRLFQLHGYPSPYQYLIRKKIARTAEWLLVEGCLVQEAARRAGFVDPYHFSRIFKRVIGQSPRAFSQHRK